MAIEQEDSLEKNAVSVTKSSDFKPKTHGTIIFWSLIASFTRFIPLPLVDDLLEAGLEKMMFKQIAQPSNSASPLIASAKMPAPAP